MRWKQMIKKLIAAILLISVMSGIACARMTQTGDQTGDQIEICATSGAVDTHYSGTITDIDNGFICLKCTSAYGKVDIREPTMDICIGIGTIYVLLWTKDVNKVLKQR
jgi:hypothetical protein